jgi:hypothetical protein
VDGIELSVAVGSAVGGAFGGVGGAALLVRGYFRSIATEIKQLHLDVVEIKVVVKEQNSAVRKHGQSLVQITTRCEERHKEG